MIDLTKRWPLGLDSGRWPLFCFAVVLGVAVLSLVDVSWSQGAIHWPEAWRAPFIAITDYGLSDWILIPSLAALILTLAGSAFLRRLPRLVAMQLAMLSGFVFLGVGAPGLMANLLKRLFGRSRPDMYETSGAFAFQPVVNEWQFQSFPSGHTTTAIALAFVVGFIWPRLFVPFFILGAIVGISRVPVGAHYPTDVFAGIVVGMLGAYLVRNFFARRGWLFVTLPDGRIVRRRFSALRRAFQRARA